MQIQLNKRHIKKGRIEIKELGRMIVNLQSIQTCRSCMSSF